MNIILILLFEPGESYQHNEACRLCVTVMKIKERPVNVCRTLTNKSSDVLCSDNLLHF